MRRLYISALGFLITLPVTACVLPSSEDSHDDFSDEGDVSSIEQEIVTWRNDQNGIILPGEAPWGSWQQRVYCNAGMWAVGYKMRVESSQGGGLSSGNDDTALNSVQLLCKDPTTGATEWISSYDGIWGDWHSSTSCSGTGNLLKGARMRIEGSQGGGDDTAANSVEFSCTKNGTIQAPGGQGWGSWGSWVQCPNDTAVCGLEIKFEGSQGGGDDTGMNGLELECCNLPAGVTCGDGQCNTVYESPQSCSTDCGYCGNGLCSVFENAWSCVQDCGYCGDGICYNESSPSCYEDCGGAGGPCSAREEMCSQ
jgi:hypothetical protein